MTTDSRRSRLRLPLISLAGSVFLICCTLVVYRPDRPVADIEPGSAPGPAFVVQIIRPRSGLPLGGLLPPRFFGLESHIGFDSKSPGASASVTSVPPTRLELRADGWDVILVADAAGRVKPETEVVFELMFEDRQRRVRCRPGEPAVGTLQIVVVLTEEDGVLSGNFDVELARCEDAETGEPLGWPSQPLVLHGSFDGLSP